ncbi:MAG: alanine--tRNA ligase [Lachnospiraceae bacterium]|nr:alanine--tRNA ligase [Lachnospiraceae bacterium]
MEKYGVNELRKMFLDFFEEKGHLKMKSFSLIPHNDNSLLLINSGMAPLKPYFTGQEVPPRRRVTTCQKCIRTGDLENVGKTARHGTFFEMLGNFSFGDYFKEEAISWCWEFLTERVGLDPDRLYPSIYLEDDEAFEIWNKKIGIPAERIFRFGKEDNFWEHGSGPCGPCSEVYYDRGETYGCGKPDCTVGCDCDRYMEIWNNVFTQFDNDGQGNYSELAQKNIDTGMGLERLASVVQDVDSIFDVDTIYALRSHVCQLAGVEYKKDYDTDVSIRIITDHMRSATFMISDGIMPSNEGRGYVLRRIIRRAARQGRKLNIDGLFLAKLAETVIEGSKDGYPELMEKHDFIINNLTKEEEQFNKTIDSGLSILAEYEEKLKSENSEVLSGEDAFRLYDTFGFPIDLTKEILEEKGLKVDEEGFKKCMQEQKEKARAARKTTNYMGADATVWDDYDANVTSVFDGYDKLTMEQSISAMAVIEEDGTSITEVLSEGQNGCIVTPVTPFYATMGGQEGDTGIIKTAEGEFEVTATEKLTGNRIGHYGVVKAGVIKTGDKAILSVDETRRHNICRNHSATHLLQKALREVLGTHVEQSGSYQDGERTRFDFSHFQAMTAEELKKVEELVNKEIAEDLCVDTQVMSIEEAKKSGAMALFGEKYADDVRVVSMGDFSKELCGGTHVSHTGDIGMFKIISENSVASGVRRITAITGDNVRAYYENIEEKMNMICHAMKTTPDHLADEIKSMLGLVKDLTVEVKELKAAAARDSLGNIMDNVKEVMGVKMVAASVPGADMNSLRDLADNIKTKIGEGVVVLASDMDGKANLVVMATDEAQKRKAHAGNLIKQLAALIGGGGGGRPNMAQAGGKNPAGIPEMIGKAEAYLEEMMK